MRVTLSAALTADGFLDDNTPQRLIISTPEDWAEVYRLRGEHDAILVGAETLRRDNPSLLIRDEEIRLRRLQEGMDPDIARVTLTASGTLSPSLRFFSAGLATSIVFSEVALPELDDIATVIPTNGHITARGIVTELEKRGIRHLFVEGGAHVLQLFLNENMADLLRIAINPALHVGALGRVPFHFERAEADSLPHHRENLGGMEVTTYTLHTDTTANDLHHLTTALELSRQCTPCATSYCVGAVVVTADGHRFTGYTHQSSPTHHAEQEAIHKALTAGVSLRGSAIYTSMEPCSQRHSEPESCTQLILHHGFTRVVFALYEPDRFAQCCGALTLREAGVEVRCYPEFGEQVKAVNAHLKL